MASKYKETANDICFILGKLYLDIAALEHEGARIKEQVAESIYRTGFCYSFFMYVLFASGLPVNAQECIGAQVVNKLPLHIPIESDYLENFEDDIGRIADMYSLSTAVASRDIKSFVEGYVYDLSLPRDSLVGLIDNVLLLALSAEKEIVSDLKELHNSDSLS